MKAYHSIKFPRCTGKKDKNGMPVYEGDVLKSRLDRLFPENITIENVVYLHGQFALMQTGCEPEPVADGDIEISEVVGNVLCRELVR